MKLSVIIPTYNEGENLFKTVQSVIALQDEIGDDGLNTKTWTANRKRSAGMYVDLNDSWHCLWKNSEAPGQVFLGGIGRKGSGVVFG